MQPLDIVTNLPRGYFLLSSNPYNKTISLCKLSHQESDNQVIINWTTLGKTFCQDIPKQLQSENPKTLEEVAKVILSNPSVLLNDLAKSPLYPIVESIYQKYKRNQPESNEQIDSKVAFATLFLLSSPSMMFSRLELELVKQIERFQDQSNMSTMLKREVKKLNEEIKDLVLNFCNCETSPGSCNSCS
ncbi:2549_t:CDS:2 [Diversispora eburnea]|uniref:2549_t:CDS:1 n=1 Tax=Diversispora eburnea TaxID=1213867 RepID=A0A9N8UY25_9GLOM|nr:2549_t:CDS:2 [Diversispora eburnea]